MRKEKSFGERVRIVKRKVENFIINVLLLAALAWIGYGTYLLVTKYIVKPYMELHAVGQRIKTPLPGREPPEDHTTTAS